MLEAVDGPLIFKECGRWTFSVLGVRVDGTSSMFGGARGSRLRLRWSIHRPTIPPSGDMSDMSGAPAPDISHGRAGGRGMESRRDPFGRVMGVELISLGVSG